MKIRAFVIAGAKKEHLTEKGEDKYEIYVKEPASRNLANKRVIEIMATEYGVETSQVSILTGHRSPNKLLLIGKQ